MSALVLATRNAGKLRELRSLFEAQGFCVESLDDAGVSVSEDEDTIEQYDTFERNALAKAQWFARLAPGRVVCADDSGLEAAALDGRPGVHSKRWAGHDVRDGPRLDAANNASLQAALAHAASTGRVDRTARFVCVAACAWTGGAMVRRGVCDGVVLSVPRGSGGFGYDPLFFSPELGATFAEADREAKASVSHRGRAFAALLSALSLAVDAKLRTAVDRARRLG